MRHVNSWMWIVGASTLLAGCAMDGDPETGKTAAEPLLLTASTRVNVEGILDYGTVVFAENPTTLLEAGDFHGYEFDGRTGGVVTITMTSKSCGAPDTLVYLFKPEDIYGNRGASLIESDDAYLATCALDSQILNFRLPVDGTYLIAATSFAQAGGGHYKLQLTCNNGACALPGSPTFATTRIAQADIDHALFTPAALFDIGDFLFETVFRVENGMGNALTTLPANNQPRPNFRKFPNNVHFAAFGAPEAQTCVTCHNVGGDDGAGDANHNIFQIGDGINRSSGVPRNPPTVLGNGLRQRIGEEMTANLASQLAAAKASAASTGVAVTKALSSKGISFGSLIANPDGTVNTAGVRGVDTDLIVKPFGWKGREATLRRFVEGGFRVHFGLQTQPSIVKHCATPNVNTFGTGANCQDPDADGVTNEITEGQLSAEAIYMGLRETPIRVPPATATLQARAASGETLFNSTGCASCHTRLMKINSPFHTEPADTTGGAGIRLNLATDTKDPHPALNTDGTMTVELWSDFKRHDVGAALADSKAFNQIAANQFITPPLWGIAVSAPYLHDGRAPTLKDAILQHAGDALTVRNAFAALTADQQLQIVEFLGTLSRTE
jgi:mono/diheme cytochrome c family protein